MVEEEYPSSIQQRLFTDNLISLNVLLFCWLVTVFLCWKVFNVIYSSEKFTRTEVQTPSKSPDRNVSKLLSSSLSPPSPKCLQPELSKSRINSPNRSSTVLGMANSSELLDVNISVLSTKANKRFISQLQLEACTKAKDSGMNG